MKLKWKLALGAAALAAVTSAMVWTLAFQAGSNAIRRRTASLTRLACTQIQEEMAQLGQDISERGKLWAADPSVVRHTADGHRTKLSQRLDSLLAVTPGCRNIAVLDRTGKLLAWTTAEVSESSGSEAERPKSPAIEVTFDPNGPLTNALQGEEVQGLGLYRWGRKDTAGPSVWQVAIPIRQDEAQLGALLVSFSWDSHLIQHLGRAVAHFQQLGLGQAQIHLLDPQGTILASNAPDQLGSQFTPRSNWLNLYPSTVLSPQQGQVVLALTQNPLGEETSRLRTRTMILGLSSGLILFVGLSALLQWLVSRPLNSLLQLSKKLLPADKASPQKSSARQRGDEIRQLEVTLTQAKLELGDRQENMENLLHELSSLNEELAQADRLKNEFVANMSHEIRTPMNGILGFAELLSQEELSSSQSEYVDTILQCGNSLLGIISDVLDLARIEAGHLQLHPRSCSVSQISSQTCQMLANKAEQKGLKVTWQVEQDVPQFVKIDAERLGQILTNLLNNAIKFTDRGFVNLNISSAWGQDKEGLRISVSDSGIGIAPEKSDLIFEPFSQADGSDSRAYGGAGLGLAICQRLIEALEGSIEFKSIQGGGSEFIVWLPFERAAELSLPQSTNAKPSADTSPGGRAKPSSAPPRVLVIEDDRICGEFFKAYLTRNGYTVMIETDGNKAVQRIKETKPDAVILDLRLPGKSGLDILAELKSKPSTEAIPVVVCSVLRCQDKALNMGALDYLCKPFTGEELLRVIQRAVRQRRLVEVLAVDDEPTVRRLYQAALTRAGLKVVTASSGREALELLAVHPQIGLVLLDLVMPGMSGFEVLDRIRNSGRTDLPVIVVTARSMSAQEKQRLEGRVQNILYKASLTPKQLLDQLQSQLGEMLNSQPRIEQPVKLKAGEQGDLAEQLDYQTRASPDSKTSPAPSGAILVAEDVVYNRRLLEVLLERAGYEVVSCTNGAQAVELAQQTLFSLIILDIQMPRVDGFEAAKLIRQIPAHACTPIIALTAKAMKGDIQRCLQAGCTDYLAKPVREKDLFQRISKYLLPPSGAASQAPKLRQVLKNAAIQSQLADDADLMEIVAAYVDELPATLGCMIHSLQTENFEELTSLAHNLKGSSGLAGYPDLAAQATLLQQSANQQNANQLVRIIKQIVELCRMVGANMEALDNSSFTAADSSDQLAPDSNASRHRRSESSPLAEPDQHLPQDQYQDPEPENPDPHN